jgi:hypothetical protein
MKIKDFLKTIAYTFNYGIPSRITINYDDVIIESVDDKYPALNFYREIDKDKDNVELIASIHEEELKELDVYSEWTENTINI